MGGSASRVAAGSAGRAAKRVLPNFERSPQSSRLDGMMKPSTSTLDDPTDTDIGTGTETSPSPSSSSGDDVPGLRPESYRAMDAAEGFSIPGTAKDEGLDQLLQQLSGSIQAKSTPIRMDKQAVAHARKLRADVQREMNKKRITVSDLERFLSGKMQRSAVVEKGVPPEVVDSLLKHVRLPREEDYVNVLEIHKHE